MWYLCVVVCDHRACISRGRTISTDTGCARNGRCVLFHAMCLTQVQQYGIFLLIIANATTCVSCTLSVLRFFLLSYHFRPQYVLPVLSCRIQFDCITFYCLIPLLHNDVPWGIYLVPLLHCCTAALVAVILLRWHAT